MNKTYSPKISEIKRDWHVLDADGQILGRLATQAATLLMGKHKPGFVRHLDSGDQVVILNSEKIKVTGKKEQNKVYTHHTGYQGGLRQITLEKQRKLKPEKILTHAIEGMLPANKLQARMLKRLHVVIGSENPYAKYN
ncbi:MAG: 50S ribosomal protein L13 [bacterium]|nr:50S ribosomal protein L13 [bacterium]